MAHNVLAALHNCFEGPPDVYPHTYESVCHMPSMYMMTETEECFGHYECDGCEGVPLLGLGGSFGASSMIPYFNI